MALPRSILPAIIFNFTAVILLLIASISTPIWNQVYFIKLNTGIVLESLDYPAQMVVTYGVFGYTNSERKICYNPDAWDSSSWQNTGDPINDNRLTPITCAMVLHPVAGGFSFIAFICSIIGTQRRAWAVLSTMVSSFSGLVALVAFCVDIVLWTWIRLAFQNLSFERSVEYGPANWIVLGSIVSLIFASVSAGITSFSQNHYPRKWSKQPQPITPQTPAFYHGYSSSGGLRNEPATSEATIGRAE